MTFSHLEAEFDSFNDGQKFVVKKVLEAERDTDRVNKVFIDGPGGTGKTTVLRHIINCMIERGEEPIVTATTGVAAQHLPGGRTFHSMFGVPITDLAIDTIFNVKRQSMRAERIRRAKVIFIDEVPSFKLKAL